MDVLCVGLAVWDISAFVDEFPVENTKVDTQTLQECPGGPAANAAGLLARWGVPVALAATVGRDAYADRILTELGAGGVDTSLVHFSPVDPTSVSVILVNQRAASRTIVNRRAASPADPCRISARPAWDQPPGVLLLDSHEPAATRDAMTLYPQARTVLDAGTARPVAVELARQVDYLVASERFAMQFAGVSDLCAAANRAAAMRALWQLNRRCVVVTLGERGLLYGTDESFEYLPAFRVDSIDTTAAGDLFHGAFAYGVLKALPLAEALGLAAAAAALSTIVRGGYASIPALARAQELQAHGG